LTGAQTLDAADVADLRAVQSGNSEMYARIVDRYQNTIAAYMWRFTRDPEQCEQLVHEVFVEAYFSLGTYRGEAPLLHWLRKIATRVGYRFWKRRARERARREVRIEFVEGVTAASSPTKDAEWRKELLHVALDLLPPRDRVILVLLYLEGLSTREASATLGWSHSLVRVQAHRAKRKLRTILQYLMGQGLHA
jgi:RNA polymerase sigma-70 factor (ECF subfamily)